jgi:hypothetical protein
MRYTTAPCSCDLSVFKSVFAFDKYAGDDLAMSVSASPGSACPTLTPHWQMVINFGVGRYRPSPVHRSLFFSSGHRPWLQHQERGRQVVG